jgi:hypothetical protein
VVSHLRASLEAAAQLLMMAVAAVFALASGAAFLGMPLLLWAIGGDERGLGAWGTAWILAAVMAGFLNIIWALEVFRRQSPRHFTMILVASAILVGSCPLWY